MPPRPHPHPGTALRKWDDVYHDDHHSGPQDVWETKISSASLPEFCGLSRPLLGPIKSRLWKRYGRILSKVLIGFEGWAGLLPPVRLPIGEGKLRWVPSKILSLEDRQSPGDFFFPLLRRPRLKQIISGKPIGRKEI